jgi:TRAP-type mannitol/chloroaromatic compound transport system substrate-binding protein
MRGFGLAGRVMSRLGATTVLLPGGWLGNAFDKHEIDAAEFLTPAVDQRQRLQDHFKFIYMPGWHQPETVLELLINQDKWNVLDDEQQTVLDIACRAMRWQRSPRARACRQPRSTISSRMASAIDLVDDSSRMASASTWSMR